MMTCTVFDIYLLMPGRLHFLSAILPADPQLYWYKKQNDQIQDKRLHPIACFVLTSFLSIWYDYCTSMVIFFCCRCHLADKPPKVFHFQPPEEVIDHFLVICTTYYILHTV